MRIVVDFDVCEANALCMGIAPDVFEVDDNDYLNVLATEPEAHLHAAVREAARACPKRAITVVE
jgi:ferredoxin